MSRFLLTPDLCRPRVLPPEADVESARASIKANPANKPNLRPGALRSIGRSPLSIAGLTSRLWPSTGVHLTVGFLDSTDQATRQKIVQFANHWGSPGRGNVKFDLTADSQGADVRVLTEADDGLWSYVGKDIEQVPRGEPTMTLSRFSYRSTPESEFYRVVEHEFGHTLGFIHEHQRLRGRFNPEGMYLLMGETQGWDKSEVDEQILDLLDEATLTATPPDTRSVMEYDFQGKYKGVNVTADGEPIVSADRIDASDAELVAKLYPQAVTPVPPVSPPPPPPPPPGKPKPPANPWAVSIEAASLVVDALVKAGVGYWRARWVVAQYSGFIFGEAARGIPAEQIARDVLARVLR